MNQPKKLEPGTVAEMRRRAGERLEILKKEQGIQPSADLAELVEGIEPPPPDEPDLFETIMRERRRWRSGAGSKVDE